jgi:hypothetical protein
MLNSVQRKLVLMFLPLLIAVLGLIVIIGDLKHPVVSRDQCLLVGRGKAVTEFKTHAHLLYSRSGRWQDDIGLQCKTMGNVLINDDVPLPLKPGQHVEVITKRYHYLPTRYYTNLIVINPNEAERATMKKPEPSKAP